MIQKDKLVILVLTNQTKPWSDIFRLGATPTWISHSRNQVDIYTYTGLKPTKFQLIREAITGRLRNSKGLFIQQLIDHLFKRIFNLNLEKQKIVGKEIFQFQPEIHSTIGARTIAAFHAVLSDKDWNYLWRANVSNYVNVDALTELLLKLPKERVAAGVLNYFGELQYLSGAGYLLSRDVVEELLSRNELWNHAYFDDVALGFALREMRIELTEIPRMRFTRHHEVHELSLRTLGKMPSFRCNGLDDRSEDILIMKALHKIMCGVDHLSD